MDFEKAYEKFLNGTATEEEIEFVRTEMNRARALNDIIDKANREEKINKAEKKDIKKALKSFNIKNTVKIFVIAFISVALIAGITLGAIFIPPYARAKDEITITVNEAEDIAVKYIMGNFADTAKNVRVIRSEREYEIDGRLSNSYFVYIIDVKFDGASQLVPGGSYEIEISAKTGKILDADRD